MLVRWQSNTYLFRDLSLSLFPLLLFSFQAGAWWYQPSIKDQRGMFTNDCLSSLLTLPAVCFDMIFLLVSCDFSSAWFSIEELSFPCHYGAQCVRARLRACVRACVWCVCGMCVCACVYMCFLFVSLPFCSSNTANTANVCAVMVLCSCMCSVPAHAMYPCCRYLLALMERQSKNLISLCFPLFITLRLLATL